MCVRACMCVRVSQCESIIIKFVSYLLCSGSAGLAQLSGMKSGDTPPKREQEIKHAGGQTIEKCQDKFCANSRTSWSSHVEFAQGIEL